MFTPQPIGFVSSPYKKPGEIPKGLGAKHEAEGVLKIMPEFEPGLTDIEGFSHLFVIWVFDRSRGFELLGTPPSDDQPHGVFATRSPRRPNPIGLTVVELLRRAAGHLHVRGVDMLDRTPILDIKPYACVATHDCQDNVARWGQDLRYERHQLICGKLAALQLLSAVSDNAPLPHDEPFLQIGQFYIGHGDTTEQGFAFVVPPRKRSRIINEIPHYLPKTMVA